MICRHFYKARIWIDMELMTANYREVCLKCGHEKDVISLDRCELSPEEWNKLVHRVTGRRRVSSGKKSTKDDAIELIKGKGTRPKNNIEDYLL